MRRSLAVLSLSLCLLGLARSAAGAGPQQYVSPSTQDRLVELFTSEGCSSCPPADRWLSSLQQDPRLWTEIVPVAFHVDYWDNLGWKDRFAAPAYSRRQRDYARGAGLSQVYTPGLLVQGREWQGWFRDPNLKLPPAAEIGVLTLEIGDDRRGVVRFKPTGTAAGDDLSVSVALLGFDLVTTVKAGENSGRQLHHDFVVLGLTRVALRRDGASFQARFDLPAATQPADRLAVAAWVSDQDKPTPLQAVGGWFAAQ